MVGWWLIGWLVNCLAGWMDKRTNRHTKAYNKDTYASRASGEMQLKRREDRVRLAYSGRTALLICA